MNELRPFFDNLWKRTLGLPQLNHYAKPKPNLDSLKKTEWSPRFEQYMRNRLIMGAFRYGLLNEKNKPIYNRLKRIEVLLNEYRYSGNDECLVDIANLCLMEFEEGVHPKKHFKAVDDGKHSKTVDGSNTYI